MKTAATIKTANPKLGPKREVSRVGTMAYYIVTPFGQLMVGTRPPHRVPAGDDRALQVRARQAAYLRLFRERWCPELGKVNRFPQQDYEFKAYVSREDLARAVAKMTLAIDSEVVKPLAEGPSGLGPTKLGREYHSYLERLWSCHLSVAEKSWSYGAWKQQPYTPRGITECQRLGHYWPVNAKVCLDCSEPNPSYPAAGPKGVFPPGYPKAAPAGSGGMGSLGAEAATAKAPAWVTAAEGDTETCAECAALIEMYLGEWVAIEDGDTTECPNSASGLHEPVGVES
jgi:hypothetical protein